MRKLIRSKITFIVILAFVLAACGAVGEVVNPYKSRFNCPMGDNGKCQNMNAAYKESSAAEYVGTGKVKPGDREAANEATVYQDSVYKKMTELLTEPNMPVIAPPKVMRVLLLPYKGSDKELFMHRYIYFVVDDYEWVLGNDIVVGEN